MIYHTQTNPFNLTIISQGSNSLELQLFQTKLKDNFLNIQLSYCQLHQLQALILNSTHKSFVLLETKQLTMSRFLQDQLEQLNRKGATIIMIPGYLNTQIKHIGAQSFDQVIKIIKQCLNRQSTDKFSPIIQIENRDSKLKKNTAHEQNKVFCYVLKSKNKQFNSLMSVLEIKYKQNDNVSFNWIDNINNLGDSSKNLILIVSQYEAISNSKIEDEIKSLKNKPYLILFKNSLNRNHSFVYYDVQISSILGIQNLINSSDYKTYFKTPLSPNNVEDIKYDHRTTLKSQNIQPQRIESAGYLGNVIKLTGRITTVKAHTSAKDILQNNHRSLDTHALIRPTTQRPSILNLQQKIERKSESSIRNLYQVKEQKEPSLQIEQFQQIPKQQQRSSLIKSSIKYSSQIKITSSGNIKSQKQIPFQKAFGSQRIIPCEALKTVRPKVNSISNNHSNTIIPTNQLKPSKPKAPIDLKVKQQSTRTSYLMKNVQLPNAPTIFQSINSKPQIQIIIKQSENLNKIRKQFKQPCYVVSTYGNLKDLQKIASSLSLLLHTVLITDQGFEYGTQTLFKKYEKFNTLIIQKGKMLTPAVIRASINSQIQVEDPVVISSQLKTHIARLSCSNRKPTSAPADFNLLIKDNLANRVSIDQFLQARVFSPDYLSKVIDRSKANVIVIEQDDFSKIKKQVSPNDKIIILAKQGQAIRGQSSKAQFTSKNPEAVTGYIRRLSVQGRAHTCVLYHYQQTGLQQQIYKKMKGKLIQQKYHDQQSLIKKTNQFSKSNLIVILNQTYSKFVSDIQRINKNIKIIIYQPNYKINNNFKIKTSKTLKELIQQLQAIAFKY